MVYDMGFSGNGYTTASTVITSEGDLRIGNSVGAAERLAIGSSGKLLKSDGSTASWETVDTADSIITTHGDIIFGNSSGNGARLGQSTSNYTLATKGSGANPAWQASPTSILSAAGDILYASGANTLAKLAKATDGDTLQLASGVPAWVTVSAGGGGAETASFIGTTGSFSTDSTSFVDVTNVTLTLPTTTAASNDCLFGFNGGCEVGTVGNNVVFALVQDTTEVAIFKAEPISLGYMFDISGNVIVDANGETGKLQMKMSGGAASNLVMSGSQYGMLTAFAS